MKPRIGLFLTVLVIILLFSAACVKSSEPDIGGNNKERVVTIAIGAEPGDLKSQGGYYDMPKIYSGLIKSDENLKPVPDLAESWEIDQDKKTITFKIRDGVKWHDGNPFSAEDVKFTFDAVRDINNTAIFSAASTNLAMVDSVDITNPDTVVFRFNEMPASTMSYLSLAIFPKHILQGTDINASSYWLRPVGTGPYVLDRWTTRQEIVFRANKNYYGKVPEIDVLRFVFIPEESTRLTMLSRGEIQATKISPKMAKMVSNTSGYQIYQQPSACWYGLSMPNQKWPFNITEVRQAIAYAANKQAMMDALFDGKGEPAYGPLNSRDPYFNKDVVFSYDPEHAKNLLREGGFEFRDGEWVSAEDGRTLEFDLHYLASTPERKNIAIALASDLNAIGIKTNLVTMTSWADFDINVARNKSNILSWGSPNDPDIPNYKLFSSKFIGDGWWNSYAYSNPRVDELLEKGHYEWDPEKRKVYYDEAQKIIAEEQPVAFMVYADSVYLIDERIGNIKPKNSPHGSGTNGGMTSEIWWNAQDWTYKG